MTQQKLDTQQISATGSQFLVDSVSAGGQTLVVPYSKIMDGTPSGTAALVINAAGSLNVNISGTAAVEVVSVVPGTGTTNLGKSLKQDQSASDVGVMALFVHTEEASKISSGEEQYAHGHVGELGGLFVEPEQHHHLDEMDATTGWTVLGNDTINLATTVNHLTGTNALTFDKVSGAANTFFGGIQKTITAVDMGALDLHDIIQSVCFVSSIADLDYIFVRIGTDSSNYNEWRVSGDDITANDFQVIGTSIGSASNAGSTGNGWNPTALSYIAVGVAFDGAGAVLSGIIFDQLGIFTGTHVAANITAEVSSSVNTANINLQKINGSPTDKGTGNAGNGSQRIVLANDQPTVAVKIVENTVTASVVIVAALPAGTNSIGGVIASQNSSALFDGTTSLTPKFANIALNTSGATTIIASVASKKLRILNLTLVAAAPTGLYLRDDADNDLMGSAASPLSFTANGGMALPYTPAGHFETSASAAFQIVPDFASSVAGSVTYVEI